MASSTSDVPTSGRNLPNIYGYRDRYLLLKYCKGREKVTPERLAAFRDSLGNRSPSPEIPVCIIGAGMAGLYTAMILQDLGIPYHIVDADVQQRVGGRVFTHKFSNVPYDYYVCWIPVFSHRVLIFAYRKLGLCGSQMYHS